MATYTSNKAGSGNPARSIHAGTTTEVAVYSTSATMSAGDVIQMVKVQPGARLVGYRLTHDGSAAISVSLGDGNDVDRFGITTSIGGTVVLNAIPEAAVDYEYTADDTIDIRYSASHTATAVSRFTLVAQVAYDN
jgi:hypothetical protein